MKKIKKSIEKFLSEGLSGIEVTTDSSFSDIKSIESLYSDIDITNQTTFKLTDGYGDFQSDIDLTGWIIKYGDSDFNILSWDNITSTIILDNPITITTNDELICTSSGLIYAKRLTTDIEFKSTFYFNRRVERWDLIVKSKNDSNKDKIDTIISGLYNLFIMARGNIKIYDTDMITQLGYMSVNINSLDDKDITDRNADMQSHLFTFVAKYYIDSRN